MTYKEYMEARRFPIGSDVRVRGAWGTGTILGVRSGGGTKDTLVIVKWDRGFTSRNQRLDALTLVGADAYDGVLTADCPECGIEAMVFYEGDYICAWCREQMEESIG